jgi:hypothetical protein
MMLAAMISGGPSSSPRNAIDVERALKANTLILCSWLYLRFNFAPEQLMVLARC